MKKLMLVMLMCLSTTVNAKNESSTTCKSSKSDTIYQLYLDVSTKTAKIDGKKFMFESQEVFKDGSGSYTIFLNDKLNQKLKVFVIKPNKIKYIITYNGKNIDMGNCVY